EKAKALAVAELMLNPGMVGLSILDSLVAGVPMVTTDYPYHSPEIGYLDSGVNGVMTAHDPQTYAAAVTDLLRHPARIEALRAGCLESAGNYTIEKMAGRFTQGILDCLVASPQASPAGGKE
ncbi:MAG: glycosyltransferase, partial [Thiobacillus sp.]|nr:glycosyltransferase [Thiobacillus sp.]